MKHEKSDNTLPPPSAKMSSAYCKSVFVEESSLAKTRPLVESSEKSSTNLLHKRNERRLHARIASLEQRVSALEALVRNLQRNGRF
jgi:hypothetical protein